MLLLAIESKQIKRRCVCSTMSGITGKTRDEDGKPRASLQHKSPLLLFQR